jgi:pyruvate-formate lyase-activating enzyme
LSQPSQPQVPVEEIKKAIDTIRKLEKMLKLRFLMIHKMNMRIAELEKRIDELNRKLIIQRTVMNYYAKKLRENRPIEREPIYKSESIYKAEEVRKKLEELKKKLREKRLSKATAPRPETTTTPEPTGDDNDFREFIKKVLSGKATVSEMPAKFKVLPEVKAEGVMRSE